MTKRQKIIASCAKPYYGNFATKEEVKEAKRLAKGKYWYDHDNEQYCSFSTGGIKRIFAVCTAHHNDICLQNNVFNFINKWRKLKAKRCAELWSIGFCQEARLLDRLS